jgi:hypothetical protein
VQDVNAILRMAWCTPAGLVGTMHVYVCETRLTALSPASTPDLISLCKLGR